MNQQAKTPAQLSAERLMGAGGMAHDAPANSKTHAYAKPRHPPRHRNPRARPGVARRPPGRCLLAEAPVLSAVAPVVAAVFASVAPAVDAVSDDHGTAEGGRQSVPQAAARRRTVRRWLLSQFLSHSPPSGAVHQCSLGWCLCSSRTVADAGERWPALLESVLGATPSRVRISYPPPALTSENVRASPSLGLAVARPVGCGGFA